MNSSRNLSVRRRKSVTRYGATAVVSATAIASAGAVVPLTAPAPGPSIGRRGGVWRTAFVIGASLLELADGAGRRAVLVLQCREVRLCSPRVVNFVAMFIGLGLESVFDMVRASNRQIDIPGAPGLGTTSRVYFPPTRNADSTAPIACRATTAGSAPGKAAIRVVAVDVSDRALVARALRVAKYVILETAGDAKAPAAVARYDGDMCLLGISYGEADARRHRPRRFVTRNAVRHSSPLHLGEGGAPRQCGRGTARGGRGSHRADLRPRGRRR